MQWLLSDPRSRYFPILFNGGVISTWGGQRLHVETLGAPADYLIELLTRIPHHVWQ